MNQNATPRPRYAGLDGLRAIAVALVVVYHLFPASPLRGGFVGVDVFFVVSGFLITSLLLRPTRLTFGRRLIDFWRRRARRLLPALAVVIAVCTTAAWAVGGDLLVGIGRQVLGAATFSFNWLSLLGGTDYFASTNPELFRNMWSLAVEEQFYVLWPLLLPVLLLLPGRWLRIAVVLGAAAASAWWMSRLADDGAITRAYFGTDSHAFGLLAGIALALALHRMPDREWMRRGAANAVAFVVGVAGIALIVLAALRPETADGGTFPGTLLIATIGSALAIAAGVWPGSRFGRALDVAPLRWVGDRSYGIYLWHWPVLLIVVAIAGPAGPVATALIALSITLLASAVSFRWLEMPVRRLGFRRCLRAVQRRLAGSRRQRIAMIGAAAAGAALVAGTGAAIATAPATTSSEQMILEGQQAMEDAGGTEDSTTAPTSPPRTPPPPPSSKDAAPSGADITAVGDSVMLASAPALYERFPGIVVDAEVSRSIWAGPRLLEDLAARGELRRYVVVALGTNGPVDIGMLKEMSRIVGPDRDLILVNASAPRDWIPGVNHDLDAFARAHNVVVVADWEGAIAPRTDLLAGDRIHPDTKGGTVFADVVEEGIERAQRERERARDVDITKKSWGPAGSSDD